MRYRAIPRGTATLARTALLLGLSALTLLLLSAPAGAVEEPKGYGELARFGEVGTETGHLSEKGTRLIGVDGEHGNVVYVLDETEEPVQAAGKYTRHLRLQRFKANSEGKYVFNASASFTDVGPSYPATTEEAPNVQGIAVDPKAGRVYVLTTEFRKKSLLQDNGTGGSDLLTAGTLYAFSTSETGGEILFGAGKEGANKEVLAGPEVLQSQSETPGAALLGPLGITVDPASGEVIALAHVDPHAHASDSIEEDHYAVQRVHANGTLGTRWLDAGDVLKKEIPGFKPQSPVVVESGGTSHIVVAYGGLEEVPSEGEGPPKRLYTSPTPKDEPIVTGINAGPQGEGAPTGGRLSAAPDGTIWGVSPDIVNEANPEAYAGLVAFAGLEGSEIGWTGGQEPIEPTKTQDKCVIEPYGYGQAWLTQRVAAGSGGKVFALAPMFLLRFEPEEIEISEEPPEFEKVPLKPPFFSPIVEFGPGGGGCREASATAPVAKVGGVEVKGEEPIPAGTKVTLSSKLKQADALKVEWEFALEGKVEKVVQSANQFRNTNLERSFPREGVYGITERIFSDDLASPTQSVYHEGGLTSPTITVTRKLTIGKPALVAGFSLPESVPVGVEAIFESESSDPNKEALPLKYVWNFGDGTPATVPSTARTVSHAYATAGTYTVTLKATDKTGLLEEATATHLIKVTGPPPPPPPPPTPPPPTPPLPQPSPTPPPGGGTGGGGVLSYRASLASTSLTVSPSGAFPITVQCLGQSSCTGTVTLTTLTAVSAGAKKRILVLGAASFSIAGGHNKAVTVRLSAKARQLLGRSHTLRVRATILARDAGGTLHNTQGIVTLRPAKRKHH
jgi:hypothetical protein